MNLVTVATSHGIFTGRTIDSIIRRVYGRNAYLVSSAGRLGMIVKKNKYGTHVLGQVRWIKEPNKTV